MEKTKQITVCATGHRPSQLPSDYGYDYRNARWSSIIADTKKIIKSLDAHRAISGMALGYDTAFAVAVLQLQNEGYKITLEAAVPCKSQADAWTDSAKKLYQAILARCEKVVCLSDAYTKDCMRNRNAYMVDNSDIVLAMLDPNISKSGTYQTVEYAKKLDRRIYNVYLVNSVLKSDFTHHETKSDLNKGSRKGDKNMEKLDLSSLEVGAEKKIHILDLLNQEEEREEAYFLQEEEKSRNANSFELYITQDPRKGFLDIDLFTNLYNFCIKAIKSRLVMILDLEKVISSLVNIEEYTYGFKENPTVTQAESLKAFYRDIKAKLSDKKVKEFIKVNNDYTVFGCDDATRCDYITTYQKVIRLLTNTCGESLEFYKDVINNVKDELQSIILDNTYEVETISLVENEESEDSLEYAY